MHTHKPVFCVKQGCCALSTCFDPCLLALPSSSTRGTMRVYNAAITGSSVECEVTAHNSPVAVMAWNQDASLLASASNKGTVLRVHKMPQVCTTLWQPNTVVAAPPGLLSVALKLFHQSTAALEKAHSTKKQQDLAVQALFACFQASNRSMSA
jgi:WD40 repeat protein